MKEKGKTNRNYMRGSDDDDRSNVWIEISCHEHRRIEKDNHRTKKNHLTHCDVEGEKRRVKRKEKK